MNKLPADQKIYAQERSFSILDEKTEIDFVSYDPSQTIKRQMFWLGWISKNLRDKQNTKRILDIGSNIFWLIGEAVAQLYPWVVFDFDFHPLVSSRRCRSLIL